MTTSMTACSDSNPTLATTQAQATGSMSRCRPSSVGVERQASRLTAVEALGLAAGGRHVVERALCQFTHALAMGLAAFRIGAQQQRGRATRRVAGELGQGLIDLTDTQQQSRRMRCRPATSHRRGSAWRVRHRGSEGKSVSA